ncbi:hypothetical protein EGR_03552 [Echinococcus granulosus]|uniref:Uncharacterized protein n=1 Tax=Echinococcus granulosus TaxID=6210 RepID=W6UK97_ECHGR|nr:hypothetical protein EGR_03552 [Echinococcus granulosus]EUB61488.1 hypothetical protein EGR_03552 [Echinococcus granulosus]
MNRRSMKKHNKNLAFFGGIALFKRGFLHTWANYLEFANDPTQPVYQIASCFKTVVKFSPINPGNLNHPIPLMCDISSIYYLNSLSVFGVINP